MHLRSHQFNVSMLNKKINFFGKKKSHWPQRFIQMNSLIHNHFYLNIRRLLFLSQESVNRILTGHSTYPALQPLNETTAVCD